MRKVIAFIIFVIIIFGVNLIFYFLSSDYRFFLKKIKENDDVVYMEEKAYNDKLKTIDIDKHQLVEVSKENEKIFNLDKDS